ncbi:alpha/beta hydrolase [Lentisphaerota bacterium ZTH]|nr:alpha/beta hydrolase [Lentisphaerota bacterium]WET05139.1 alpha/beta hydrolase [Lentisphaerota bacterium ZTH]
MFSINQPDNAVEEWHGYRLYNFSLKGTACKVVCPHREAEGTPWLWRARFFDEWPYIDLAMLEAGCHVAYTDVANLFGSSKALVKFDLFYNYLVKKHAFNPKVALVGYSRGGLTVYNWAARNPDKTACIYADNPVCDFKSWPGGKGNGPGCKQSWKECLEAYGLNEAEAIEFKGNPIDNLRPLAKANIPLLHIVGDSDEAVPVSENTNTLANRYSKLGGYIEIIHKPGEKHQPHSLKNPTPIAEFIKLHYLEGLKSC